MTSDLHRSHRICSQWRCDTPRELMRQSCRVSLSELCMLSFAVGCPHVHTWLTLDRSSEGVTTEFRFTGLDVGESGYRVPAGTLLIQLLRDCATRGAE